MLCRLGLKATLLANILFFKMDSIQIFVIYLFYYSLNPFTNSNQGYKNSTIVKIRIREVETFTKRFILSALKIDISIFILFYNLVQSCTVIFNIIKVF